MANIFDNYTIDDFSLPEIAAVKNSSGKVKIRGKVNPTYRSKMTSLQNKYNKALLTLQNKYEKEVLDFGLDISDMKMASEKSIRDITSSQKENALARGMARASYSDDLINENVSGINENYQQVQKRRQLINDMLKRQYNIEVESNYRQTNSDIQSIRLSRLEKMMEALAKLKPIQTKTRTRTVYVTKKPGIEDFKKLEGRRVYSF